MEDNNFKTGFLAGIEAAKNHLATLDYSDSPVFQGIMYKASEYPELLDLEASLNKRGVDVVFNDPPVYEFAVLQWKTNFSFEDASGKLTVLGNAKTKKLLGSFRIELINSTGVAKESGIFFSKLPRACDVSTADAIIVAIMTLQESA